MIKRRSNRSVRVATEDFSAFVGPRPRRWWIGASGAGEAHGLVDVDGNRLCFSRAFDHRSRVHRQRHRPFVGAHVIRRLALELAALNVRRTMNRQRSIFTDRTISERPLIQIPIDMIVLPPLQQISTDRIVPGNHWLRISGGVARQRNGLALNQVEGGLRRHDGGRRENFDAYGASSFTGGVRGGANVHSGVVGAGAMDNDATLLLKEHVNACNRQ